MEGECFEHNLRWFEGGVECPLCKLEALAKDLDNKILYYGFEVAALIKEAAQQSVQSDVWRAVVNLKLASVPPHAANASR